MNRPRAGAYLELLRISNVLTAVADVWMGMAVTLGAFAAPAPAAALTLASIGLYLSGMVLNDVFGAAEDAASRSARPIPSGRISRQTAARLGAALMVLGLAAAGATSLLVRGPLPMLVATCLAAAILLYDWLPKLHVTKPWLMGACRGLNVLLGMSLAGGTLGPRLWLIALGSLVYIAGVTLFARTEAEQSRRAPLAIATMIAIAGLALFAATPLIPAGSGGPALVATPMAWALLWGVTLLLILRRFTAALLRPTPRRVQAAVGNAIQGVIVIDAALAWGYAGQFWGLAILALLPPTMLLARRIAQT